MTNRQFGCYNLPRLFSSKYWKHWMILFAYFFVLEHSKHQTQTNIHSLEMDVLIMLVQAKFNRIIFEDLESRSCFFENPEPSFDRLKHRRIFPTLNMSDPKRTHQPRNTAVTYDRGTVSFPSNPTSAGQRLTTQVHWWNFHSQLFSIGLPKFS